MIEGNLWVEGKLWVIAININSQTTFTDLFLKFFAAECKASDGPINHPSHSHNSNEQQASSISFLLQSCCEVRPMTHEEERTCHGW